MLSHPINHPISLILDHSHFLPLLDDPLLSVPPLNSLVETIHLILPLLHVANLAHNHKQLIIALDLVLISNVLVAYTLVVEHELMGDHLELLLVLEEGVEEQFEVERDSMQLWFLLEDVLVGLPEFGQWLEYSFHAIKIISNLGWLMMD